MSMAREPLQQCHTHRAARRSVAPRVATARTAVINQHKTAADGLDAEQQVAVTSPGSHKRLAMALIAQQQV